MSAHYFWNLKTELQKESSSLKLWCFRHRNVVTLIVMLEQIPDSFLREAWTYQGEISRLTSKQGWVNLLNRLVSCPTSQDPRHIC